MTDFDPGPGWRMEQFQDEVPRGVVAYREADGSWSYWVRESPVPPLPTAEETVIDAWWGTENHQRMHLYDGAWHTSNGIGFTSTEMAQVVRFEVLAEPRAVTARAVLDRVAAYLPDMRGTLDRILREFEEEQP